VVGFALLCKYYRLVLLETTPEEGI
jgi:hypothetical protein